MRMGVWVVCVCGERWECIGGVFCAVCCDLLHSCARFYKCNALHYGTAFSSLLPPSCICKVSNILPLLLRMCHIVLYLYICPPVCVVCVCVWRSSRINIPYGVIFLSFVLYALRSFKSGVDIRVGIIWLPFCLFSVSVSVPVSVSVSVCVAGFWG